MLGFLNIFKKASPLLILIQMWPGVPAMPDDGQQSNDVDKAEANERDCRHGREILPVLDPRIPHQTQDHAKDGVGKVAHRPLIPLLPTAQTACTQSIIVQFSTQSIIVQFSLY